MRLWTAFFLSLLLTLPCQADSGLAPERTHAVILGVLEWTSPKIPNFPKHGRQDRVLYETLLSRGVPEENIDFLQDAGATREESFAALSRLSERTQAGDTLIFYYAGHGTDWDGVVRFYEHDALPNQGMTMGELSESIAQNFKGKDVLLFADCCFSGGLFQVAEELEGQGFRAAALTSSLADAPSGPTWTYTMTLIDCFKGLRVCDRDLNHRVTLEEARDEIVDALAYTQRQVAGSSFKGLSPGYALSHITSIDTIPRFPEAFQAYEYGRLIFKKSWRGVRLMDFEDGLVSAQIQGYSHRRAAWLPIRAIRPNRKPPKKTLGPAGEVQASVKGRYQDLLARIEVEHDHLDFEPLHERGLRTLKVYGQHENFPHGYWVYLYPYWYIWKTDSSFTL